MKIATFTVNSIRARMEPLLAWLRQHHPDALCLPETIQDADFPRAPLEAAGWQVVFRGEKAYNGVALVSRTPAEEVRFGLDDGGPADEARLLCAQVGGVTIVNTYVPQGRELTHAMYQYKLDWFRRLRRFFGRHFQPTDLVLWCGDLNVAAEPQDVHAPEQHLEHVCFHAEVRRALADCRQWGFVDVYRRFHPEAGRFSFFDYRTQQAVQRNIGWRLDYLLASPALAARATAAEIDLTPRRAPRASDHTPVWAEFDLP
ncbi:MAG: exodeoxyribonuclease III [Kiritimatiellaeota bacterium]|nr:exodeoxyribonuclease III [Kiritimatiellota bacterium]